MIFKIRASACGQIMGVKGLGKTGETYVKEWLKSEIYGKKKQVISKFMTKGTLEEDRNIDFACNFLGFNAIKNEQYFENDFMCGTPDIILDNEIIDIKSSWDCFTFPIFDDEINIDYYYQLQCYMHLTGKKKSRLVYILGETPENIIVSEAKKLVYNFGYEFEEAYEMTVDRFNYSKVSDRLKIKTFDIAYDNLIISKIESRVIECRLLIDKIMSI
jgi:hypothetical protein